MKTTNNHICQRCYKTFKNNYTLTRHINRKNPCKSVKIKANLNNTTHIPSIIKKEKINIYNDNIQKKLQKNKDIWKQLNQININNFDNIKPTNIVNNNNDNNNKSFKFDEIMKEINQDNIYINKTYRLNDIIQKINKEIDYIKLICQNDKINKNLLKPLKELHSNIAKSINTYSVHVQ